LPVELVCRRGCIVPHVTLERVTKVFDNGLRAVSDLDLTVGDGELLVLVGPSGCGKTTTLRLIAGLESPTAGDIRIGSRVMNAVPPWQRKVAMVFQRPALFPNRTIRDNLRFGHDLRHPFRRWLARLPWPRRGVYKDHAQTFDETVDSLGLKDLLDRYPSELSGGQQQRAALGRALLRRPDVFLLDEPLGHLDPPLRLELRRELHLLQRRLLATMIYVTHDPLEALNLGDRIAVLRGGSLQQVDRPEVVRERPVNRFVAEFMGTLPMNCLDGHLQVIDGRPVLTGAGWKITVPHAVAARWQNLLDREVTLGIRPEEVAIASGFSDNTGDAFPLTVRLVERDGRDTWVECVRGAMCVMGRWEARGLAVEEGKTVMVSLNWQRAYVFERPSGRTLEVPAG
jgi:multiple sugar transport system ATP-binding protein